MIDPKGMSAEATEGGSIGFAGMRLWKVVTVIRSSDDSQLVVAPQWCVMVLLYN